MPQSSYSIASCFGGPALLLAIAISMSACERQSEKDSLAMDPSPEPLSADIREISLPIEDTDLRDSTLPGLQIANQKCTICHSVDYINFQPPNMNLEQWTEEVSKMVHSYGAPIDEVEVGMIGAYFAVNYGSANASDADVVSASVIPEPVQVESTDVTGLLGANACLACHALDSTLVGPSFSDVAARYSGDAQALNNLTISVQQGGQGKWGQIPMPAMPNLSEEQARALAAYVLDR